MRVRTATAKTLRGLFLRDVAEHVLQADGATAAGANARSNYLRIDIDGFIPKAERQQMLEAQLSKELGQILINYSKPQRQTIAPGERGSHFLQALE